MQGIINRALQCFVRDIYGMGVWQRVVADAGLGFVNFEAMLEYDPVDTERVLGALQNLLDRSRTTVCEDLGIHQC